MTNNKDRKCGCDQIGAKDNAVWFLSVLWTKMNYALNLWYHHVKGKGWLTSISRTFAVCEYALQNLILVQVSR